MCATDLASRGDGPARNVLASSHSRRAAALHLASRGLSYARASHCAAALAPHHQMRAPLTQDVHQ